MTEPVIIAIIGGIVSTLSLALTLLIKSKVETTHKLINSRMDEMLKLTRDASKAEGNKEGREEQKAETAIVANVNPIELKIGKLEVEMKPPTPPEEKT